MTELDQSTSGELYLFWYWKKTRMSTLVGGPHCKEVAFALLTQRPLVQIPASTRTHLVLFKGFCKCSLRRRPDISTKKAVQRIELHKFFKWLILPYFGSCISRKRCMPTVKAETKKTATTIFFSEAINYKFLNSLQGCNFCPKDSKVKASILGNGPRFVAFMAVMCNLCFVEWVPWDWVERPREENPKKPKILFFRFRERFSRDFVGRHDSYSWISRATLSHSSTSALVP